MSAFPPDSFIVSEVVPSPNFDERKDGRPPDMILLHYTGMKTGDSALQRLTVAESKVSSHYVVFEDGRIIECVPEDKRAWHAGESSWAGETDINSRSIGIEIVNPGHEFGYTDFPLRQIAALISLAKSILTRREMRSGVFSFCKAIDTFCPLGPWIVTPDEIADPHDLRMELRVNGAPRQESHSSRMSVTIPEILSHYSALTYSAGDVLSTGTVAGVAGFSPDAASLYLKPGDVMECEIEGIGVLRNRVISWQEGHGEPAPPRIRW
jgi:hypothetical protein